MFSSIGWPEIIFILVLGLIIVGPERLPKLVEDFRAAVYAARKAIRNAKAELNDDMGDVTKEFEDFRKPVSTIASYARMSPRTAFTKALLDDDDKFLDDFDPRKIMDGPTAGQAYRAGGKVESTEVPNPQSTNQPAAGNANPGAGAAGGANTQPNNAAQHNPGAPGAPGKPGAAPGQPRTSYSWEDLI